MPNPILQKFYFTFGFGQHMGPNRRPLARHYTMVEAATRAGAQAIMFSKRYRHDKPDSPFGVWAFDYTEQEKPDTIDRHNLTFIDYGELQPQYGDNF